MNRRPCIYCLNPPPSPHSNSHFIPECLGGKRILKNLVCETCNRKIGKFEQRICEDLSFYRWYLGIKSSGRPASTKAEFHVGGEIINVLLKNGIKTKSGFITPIIKQNNSSRFFNLIADSPDNLAKQYKQQFAKKFGDKFDINKVEPIDIKVVFPAETIKTNSTDFLRLAAKIAFERFAQKRYKQAISNEYDQIRNYIKTGKSDLEKLAFLIFEYKLANNILNFPFPHHSILIFGYNGIVGSIVIIFGLFYYFVYLNKNALIIQNWEDFFIYDPKQKRKIHHIYASYPSIPNLLAAVNKSLNDQDVFNKANTYARKKFNLFLKL